MDNGKLQSFCVGFCPYPSNISTVVSAGDLEVLLSHSPAESLMQVSLTIGHLANQKCTLKKKKNIGYIPIKLEAFSNSLQKFANNCGVS